MAPLTGLYPDTDVRFLQFAGKSYVFNGRNRMRKADGAAFRFAGIRPWGTLAPAPAVAAGAGTLTGDYRYYIAPGNSAHYDAAGFAIKGLPTLVGDVTLAAQGGSLTNLPTTHPDPQVDRLYIFRNKDGYYDQYLADEDQDFFLVKVLTLGTASWVDTLADDALDALERMSFERNTPPTFGRARLFGERMLGYWCPPLQTGTATVNGGDPTKIDFSGVTLPDGVLGCWFKKNGEAAQYEITAYNSGTQVTLDRAFVGALSGAAYTIFRYDWEIYVSAWRDMEAWGKSGEWARWRIVMPDRLKVSAVEVLDSKAYVFTPTSIYALYGRGTAFEDVKLYPDPVFQGIGCVGPDAVCVVDNTIYFLSLRGPMAMRGGEPEPIGEAWGREWLDTANPLQLERALVWSDGRYIWFSFAGTGQTENNITYRLDRLTRTWWPEGAFHPRCFLADRDADGKARAFVGQGRFIIEQAKGFYDLADAASGTIRGTVPVAAHTTTSLLLATASFDVTGNPNGGLAEAYIRFYRANRFMAERRISTNTATVINWAASGAGGGTSYTPLSGDTYEIGAVAASWRTKTWEVKAHMKRDGYLHFGLENFASSTESLYFTDIIDQQTRQAGGVNQTYAVAADLAEKKHDAASRQNQYAAIVEWRRNASDLSARLGINWLELETQPESDDK